MCDALERLSEEPDSEEAYQAACDSLRPLHLHLGSIGVAVPPWTDPPGAGTKS